MTWRGRPSSVITALRKHVSLLARYHLAAWSSGMTLVLGARGPGLNACSSPMRGAGAEPSMKRPNFETTRRCVGRGAPARVAAAVAPLRRPQGRFTSGHSLAS